MNLEKILKEDRKTKQLTYEYILPDYEGTLKRVMMTDTRVHPAERSLLSDEMILSGEVVFSMLYLTVDNTLQSLHFEVPYECSFSVDSSADVHIDSVSLSSFSCLPSGPRRVIAKAEIVATVTDVVYYEPSSLCADSSLAVLCEERDFHTHIYSKKEQREYAEDIYSCDGEEPTVLYSDATVELSECRVMKDGVTVSGVCHIRALLEEKENGVRSVQGEIPFDEFLPMGENLPEKAFLLPKVTLTGFWLTVQKEEGVCHLVANPTLSFLVRATKEDTAPFAVDAFSDACDISLACESVTLLRELSPIRHRQKLECRLPKSEGDPMPMRSVLFAKSEGTLVECTPDNGVVYIMMKLTHSVVGTDGCSSDATVDGEVVDEGVKEMCFIRQRAESTHALNIPCSIVPKDCVCEVHSFTLLPPEIYEEEDAFLLVCEVEFTLALHCENVLSLIVGYQPLERVYEKEKNTYIITFPDATATLWSLAKENHSKIDDILSLNPDIHCSAEFYNTPHSLSGISRVLLP